MKCIVNLRKVVETTVVIDVGKAGSIEEANEKADKILSAGNYQKKWERVKNIDCYLGSEYISHKTCNDDEVLCSAEDVAHYYGCDNAEGLHRALFKYTEAGLDAIWTDDQMTLTACVEGADCDGPSETLEFPFTTADFDAAIKNLECLADEMWREWNDEDDDENGMTACAEETDDSTEGESPVSAK